MDDFSRGELIYNLVINLGTNHWTRISCANHRLNLAIRSAITNHCQICEDLSKINSFISSIRHSYNLSRVFQDKKCRLRLENSTRCGTNFLCFEVLIKVMDKISFIVNACLLMKVL